MRYTTRISFCFVLGLCCWTHPSSAQAPGPAWEVYYQTTYDDGAVRDLNTVPKTNKGIRRVVRISRSEGDPAPSGYEKVSTGTVVLEVVNRGQTLTHGLVWNGRAWVAPALEAPPLSRSGRDAQTREVLRLECQRVETLLAELRARLVRRDHAVAEALRTLARAKGTDAEASASKTLAKATEHRKTLLDAIRLYELQLKGLSDSAPDQAPRPTGKVTSTQPVRADKRVLGLDEQIDDAQTLPHKVQVWGLPRAKGQRGYSVAMAHPEAGPFGAFHYVAYADTNADQRPDKLIARSALAVSDVAGGWTNWDFTTSEPVVFVGNAWSDPDTSVYFAPRPREYINDHWYGLSDEVYVSGFFGGVPDYPYPYGPYLTNIRVRVTNPSGPVESASPEIIVR